MQAYLKKKKKAMPKRRDSNKSTQIFKKHQLTSLHFNSNEEKHM